MKTALLPTAILLLPALCFAQTTWYVPDDFATIQAAINGSANGDSIIVRPGTYVENIDFVGKSIKLKSELGPAVTVIDGNQAGSVVVFQSRENGESALVGFTITNGKANLGGGVFCTNDSHPTITGNLITANAVTGDIGKGAGVCCDQGSCPRIAENTIMQNDATPTNCGGGGIYCFNSSPVIARNIIKQNSAGWGSGIYSYGTSYPAIRANAIFENDGKGAIFCFRGAGEIVNNIIFRNRASHGGGIYCTTDNSPHIINNTIFENAASVGGGIYCRDNASPSVVNTILWNNDAAVGQQIFLDDYGSPSSLSIKYSDVQGGMAAVHVDPGCVLDSGPGMIDSDPLFADATIDDFHLTWNSPCKESGDNTVVTEAEDFEGDSRIGGGVVDMGADEYGVHLYLTGDAIPGGAAAFHVIGVPETEPVRIYHGPLRSIPLSTQFGVLYIKQPWKHIWSIGPVPADGIATTTKTIPTGVYPGKAFYFQALHGSAGDSDTELTNLLHLTVE